MKTILSFLLLITTYPLNAFELAEYYCEKKRDSELCNASCYKSSFFVRKYSFDVNEKKNLIVYEELEKKKNGFGWEKKYSAILDNCKIANKNNWECDQALEGKPGTAIAGLRWIDRFIMHSGRFHRETALDLESPDNGGNCGK